MEAMERPQGWSGSDSGGGGSGSSGDGSGGGGGGGEAKLCAVRFAAIAHKC